MRIILVFLFVIGYNSYIKAQRYFADYMVIGTSLTYMRNSNKDSYKTDYGYDEFTWNTNVGIQISKRLFTGLQVLNIYSSQISLPKKYYVVYGLFSQYDFLKSIEHRLFAEISINRGNYCTCVDIPYQVDDLYYIGFGAGYDYPQHFKVMNITKSGSMRWKSYYWVFLSNALIGKQVGAEEIGNGVWKVFYRDVFLGYFN